MEKEISRNKRRWWQSTGVEGMTKREWEDITDTKYAVIVRRLRTPWGWLVMTVDEVVHKNHDGVLGWSGYDWRTSITFVFDPFHWWKP